MNTCIRPHCAIRSHRHGEFAKSLRYLPKFCEIALRYPINDRELIDNYDFLLDLSNLYSDKTKCLDIFRNMLISIEKEKNFELKKLKVLYLFTMVSTPICRILKRENVIFANAVTDAYYRALQQCSDDNDFVTQMIMNYRI